MEASDIILKFIFVCALIIYAQPKREDENWICSLKNLIRYNGFVLLCVYVLMLILTTVEKLCQVIQ